MYAAALVLEKQHCSKMSITPTRLVTSSMLSFGLQLLSLVFQRCRIVLLIHNLDLGIHHSNCETENHVRKLKLLEYLKTKKFLLICNDMWSPLDLNELGVEFGHDKGSKFICSSHMIHVIEGMGTKNSLYIQLLTHKESW